MGLDQALRHATRAVLRPLGRLVTYRRYDEGTYDPATQQVDRPMLEHTVRMQLATVTAREIGTNPLLRSGDQWGLVEAGDDTNALPGRPAQGDEVDLVDLDEFGGPLERTLTVVTWEVVPGQSQDVAYRCLLRGAA